MITKPAKTATREAAILAELARARGTLFELVDRLCMRRSRVRYSLDCMRRAGLVYRSGWVPVPGHKGTTRFIPVFAIGSEPEPRPPSGKKDTSRLDFGTGAHLQGWFHHAQVIPR